MTRLLITTPTHLSQIAKKELSYHRYRARVLSPSLLVLDTDDVGIATINLRSRVANRVYLVLAEGKTTDFESYFQLVGQIDRSKYIAPGSRIQIGASVTGSILHHQPSLQSIAKKAIIRSLTGSPDVHRSESESIFSPDIHIIIVQDQCYVCLDTSGKSLHHRGYRLDTGDAPLKENVAAALVLMSNRTYHLPLYDICCGSGTICLEASMIAKNIAPGFLRTFAFEQRDRYDHHIIDQVRQQAGDRKIDKTHAIVGSDVNPQALVHAQANMHRLGLGEIIQRVQADCQDYSDRVMQGSLICNPPYGHRLHPDDIEHIYHTISRLYTTNADLTGGCITGYEYADDYFQSFAFQSKLLYNGAQEVMRYQKKI